MTGYGGLPDNTRTQKEKVILALTELSKEQAPRIYFKPSEIEEFCRTKWPNWVYPPDKQTTVGTSIRRVLQNHSSDAKYFHDEAPTAMRRETGGPHDLFSRGEGDGWALRELSEPKQIDLDIESLEKSWGSHESTSEGGIRYRLIGERERRPEVRKMALEAHGYSCMGCALDFGVAYGERGHGFIEVHHSIPLSEGERETTEEDLVVLCSNCHRMVHRKEPLLTLRELRRIINPDYLGMIEELS